MDEVLAHALVPLLDARLVLYQHCLELDRRVKRAASHDQVCMRMMFTTNNDLFNERAMDRSGIPYSNGFAATVERRFNPATYRRALAEQLDISSKRWAAVDGFVHFCKLHGSVNWTEEETDLFPIRESADKLDPTQDRVMIYPTPSKQTASFGSPYSDMFREFQGQIVQDQSVLFVMGFNRTNSLGAR